MSTKHNSKKPSNLPVVSQTMDNTAASIPEAPTTEAPKVWCNRGPHQHKFMLLHPYANKTHSGTFSSSKKPYEVNVTL